MMRVVRLCIELLAIVFPRGPLSRAGSDGIVAVASLCGFGETRKSIKSRCRRRMEGELDDNPDYKESQATG